MTQTGLLLNVPVPVGTLPSAVFSMNDRSLFSIRHMQRDLSHVERCGQYKPQFKKISFIQPKACDRSDQAFDISVILIETRFLLFLEVSVDVFRTCTQGLRVMFHSLDESSCFLATGQYLHH